MTRGPSATLDPLAKKRQELALVERLIALRKAKDDLLTYTRLTMPDPEAPDDVSRSLFETTPFHASIAKALQDVEAGRTTQLIFCMPPRHGKTELATKRFAAWLSGRNPHWDLAVASYSDNMAADFGADVRNILLSAPHQQIFPGYKLRKGGAAKDNIQTTEGGRLVFVGRGGALTGRGAHCLLMDDLFKDHEEARSQTIRDQAWNWFTRVAMTRRMGKKLAVITMTRWHSDDVIGRLTDPDNPHYNEIEAAKWKIIRLPALAEDDDPAGRPPGRALWPERFDEDFLHSFQRMDPLGFAALYQQSPTVADGVLFRRENILRYRHHELPSELRYYCASDHAVSTSQRADYTFLVKVGIDRMGNCYVIDVFWDRVSSDRAVEAMLAMAGGERRPLLWWAERGHITKSIGPFLHKRMLESGTYINIVEVTPVGDKEQRAQSIAARVSMGKVLIPSDRPWGDRLVEQMLAFPNGTHDDGVDALSLIGLGLQSQFGAPPPTTVLAGARYGTLGWVRENERWQKHLRAQTATGGF